MKELQLKIGGIWGCITAVVVTLLICGTAVFITLQNNQTQKDIAKTQAQAKQDSAEKIENGLTKIGNGICKTTDRQFAICN